MSRFKENILRLCYITAWLLLLKKTVLKLRIVRNIKTGLKCVKIYFIPVLSVEERTV
jgi:hypothetical protein